MDATEQVLALLELRFADLERQVVGGKKPVARRSGSVCEDLLTADCNVSAVLSGHESIGAVARRLEQLDRFLDPTFEETCGPRDVEAKAEAVLAALPQLEREGRMLEQLREQMPALDSRELTDVVRLTARLEKLTVGVLESKESLDEVSVKVAALLQRYNDVVASVEEMFGRWDDALTRIEYSRIARKDVE
ncbi:dynactin subunit 3-like [Bacillus rossius redtenbacheri]|uniref:dynactin subunit 3-like n=1 Tax=Bacillus rossius redtenbacheri TaxID=93214 RepID=UPI002FDDE47C